MTPITDTITIYDTIFVNDTIPVRLVKESVTALDYISNPGTIIAIIALIISVLGITFSVIYNRRTLKQSINHNKLSVKPMITYHHSNVARNQTFSILNNGLGPAEITSVLFYHREKLYPTIIELYKHNNNNIYELIDINNSEATTFGAKSYLAANGQVLSHNINFTESPKGLKIFLREVIIVITYKNVYGEPYKFRSPLQ